MNGEIAKRHWKWATNALHAANRDALNHDPQNAVSRAYYAMMHAANAALAAKGLQAKTHSGTQALFNQHLVRPGLVDKERGRDLARGQEGRTSAEYDVSKDVSESQGHEQVKRATAFLSEIRTHLRRAGLREEELAPVPPSAKERAHPTERPNTELSAGAQKQKVRIGEIPKDPAEAPAPAGTGKRETKGRGQNRYEPPT